MSPHSNILDDCTNVQCTMSTTLTILYTLYTLKYIHSNAHYYVCYEEVDIRLNCTFRVDLHYINCFHDVRSKLHSVTVL